MSDDIQIAPKESVASPGILGKRPGSPGRAGRAHPELADAKTSHALDRIRRDARAAQRSKFAQPHEEIVLEPREEDFCQYVVAGYSIAGAWRLAFDKPDEVLAYRHGRLLSTQARIALRINDLLEARRASIMDEGERIRNLIAVRLEDEALHAREGAVRLRAIENLGKLAHVQAFQERKKIDEGSSSEEIERELVTRIEKLLKVRSAG